MTVAGIQEYLKEHPEERVEEEDYRLKGEQTIEGYRESSLSAPLALSEIYVPSAMDCFLTNFYISGNKTALFFSEVGETIGRAIGYEIGDEAKEDQSELRRRAILEDETRQLTMGAASGSAAIAGFVGQIVNPLNIAAASVITSGFGAVGGALGRAAESCLSSRGIFESVKYVGNVSKIAGEFATFDVIENGTRKFMELPVEDIGQGAMTSAIIGGALGAIGYGIPKIQRFLKDMNYQVNHPNATFEVDIDKLARVETREEAIALISGPTAAIGLAATLTGSDEAEGVSLSGIAKSAKSVIAKASESGTTNYSADWLKVMPRLKGLMNSSPTVRKATEVYLGNRFETSETGITYSVLDQLNGTARGTLANINDEINKHFERWRKGEERNGLSKREAYSQFTQEWSYAAIEGGVSTDPIISGLAGKCREIFRKLRDEAIEENLFAHPENMRDDYFPQRWSIQKIKADREGFNETLLTTIRKNNPSLDEIKIRDIANDIIETIEFREGIPQYGRPDGSPVTSYFKERKIKVDQADIIDYLESDPRKVMSDYIHAMTFATAESRNLKQIGVENHEQLIQKYKDEVGGRITTVEASQAIKFLRELPQLTSGAMDAEARRKFSSLMGGATIPNLLKMLDNMNVATLLGGLGLSAIEDIAINLARGGLGKHITRILKNSFSDDVYGLSRADAQMFGFCCDRMLDGLRYVGENSTVMESITSSLESGGISGAIEDFAGFLANKSGDLANMIVNLSLIRHIDDVRELAAAQLNAVKLADELLNGKKTVFTADKAKQIRWEIKQYAEYDADGVPNLNVNLWDREVLYDFMGEVNRRVRQEVIRPDVGDVPNALRTPVGRLFSMFYRFAFGITNTVLLPLYEGGHYGELARLMGWGLALAALREITRGALNGTPYDFDSEKDMSQLWSRALTRMPIGIFEPLVKYAVGPYGETKAHGIRDVVYAAVRGGSLKYAVDFAAAEKRWEKPKPFSEKEIRRQLKLIPGNNIMYIAPIINYFAVPALAKSE
jgi:hypothetical protein